MIKSKDDEHSKSVVISPLHITMKLDKADLYFVQGLARKVFIPPVISYSLLLVLIVSKINLGISSYHIFILSNLSFHNS